MSIKAIFPPGLAELTVHGLHQWDYGRKLKVVAEGLPAEVEIHFACAGMETAVVRFCGAKSNAFLAAIPDQCLEQTTPITAWVFEVGETSGKTLLTVHLPIIARTKPQPAPTVPEDVSDKYTEAVAAMNGLADEYEAFLDEADNKIDDALKSLESFTPAFARALTLTQSDATLNSQLEFEITEPGVYLVFFPSGDGVNTVSSLIAIPNLMYDAFGTAAYCANPDGDFGYASARYSAITKVNPIRSQVLYVRHSDHQGINIEPTAVYKIADIT